MASRAGSTVSGANACAAPWIEPREDSLRICRLCGHCEQKVDVGGVGVRSSDPDFDLV